MTHRFINADSLASTGQGFIGTNMFAYCLNNPVNMSDSCGNRPIWERDYGNGLVGYTDTGTGTPYIYSQEAEHVKNMSVGLSTVGRAGCGPVATYNAEVSLGNQPNFDDILDYYGVSNTFLFGYAGVLPDKVISYFEEQGYKVIYSDDILSFSAISATADTCIMWYLYYSDSFPGFGGHYIQYDRVNSSYFARNVYTGRNCISFKYPEDFATAGKHFYAICIGIYEP